MDMRDVAPCRGKVLIVDDNAALARTLERMLCEANDVTTTTRAEDALAAIVAAAEAGGFDVIFCDMMMPEMSGIDLYDRLIAKHPAQARRMVFMTGGAFTATAEAFLASGKNLHIAKPFESETVKAIVRDYAKRRG
jgi:CheY-like chemotaxis protein